MRRGWRGILPKFPEYHWGPGFLPPRCTGNSIIMEMLCCMCVYVCVCVLGKEELAMGSYAAKVRDLLWRQLHGEPVGTAEARVLVREVG